MSYANAGTMLKRRIDNRNYGNGGFQEDWNNHYAPLQKRARSQTQTNSRIPPLYNNHCSNVDYQKSFGFQNPNPQFVPFPLPYRKLNDDDVSFDSLPEWDPNESLNQSNLSNFPTRSSNYAVPNITGSRFNAMTHPNMISLVSQAMPQPILSKNLTDFLTALNKEKEKQISNNEESPLGLDFDPAKLKVRHESVIKSLYSDMPRQCSSCGMRFKCQEDHSKHMDWHVKKNRMAKEANKTTLRLSQKPKKSRGWLASASLWLSAAAIGDTTKEAKACFNANGETQEEEQERRVVPADENQKTCALCVEPFEEFFSHEDDDWMYKDAVYLEGNESGLLVHAKCGLVRISSS